MDTDGRREDSGRGVREYRRYDPGSNSGRWEVGGGSAGAFGGTIGGLVWALGDKMRTNAPQSSRRPGR